MKGREIVPSLWTPANKLFVHVIVVFVTSLTAIITRKIIIEEVLQAVHHIH